MAPNVAEACAVIQHVAFAASHTIFLITLEAKHDSVAKAASACQLGVAGDYHTRCYDIAQHGLEH